MKELKKKKFMKNFVKNFPTSLDEIETRLIMESESDIELFKKFMKISEKLTADLQLDAELGKKYLEHFILANKQNRRKILELHTYLQNQIPETRKDLKKLSKEILISWYTGIVKVNGISRLVTYSGSHTWTKLKGIKPHGICGGRFGYWSRRQKIS
ncbi:sugar dehydrogenase complex small subunit [Pigmentibacter sp. JX0631]|uniref:sugar dehydrogenase complex small subunit n=1 Tax=Pigmentibacter sp. JX0631 TaxID=2976982 RepID=UPI0024696035|nr:sugar dehydrogenase complex small subunit [Pigmentibacter sp. JX0631]WGL60057.1 sugar dehydrogenase complex small subunit [Pigmentibacter sp. JX0631]